MEDRKLTPNQTEQQQWRRERARWIEDSRRWQTEHVDALAELTTLQAEVLANSAALRRHIEAVEGQARASAMHEHEVDVSTPAGAGYLGLIATHRRLAAEHTTLRDKHERTTRYHRAVLAQLSKLKTAIDAEFAASPPERLESGLRHTLGRLRREGT